MKKLLSAALALLLAASLLPAAAAAETGRFGEPETAALVIGGDAVKNGTGFRKSVVWLSGDDLDAIAAAPSGESTYRLGLGDSMSELLTYSTFENHGVPVYGWRRVYGLDLKLLAQALGVDTAQVCSVTALSSDGMSKTLPDAFGAETPRYAFDPAGKATGSRSPILALFETSSETETQSEGTYPAAPQLGADSPDRVSCVFGYGQTEPTEVTACFWVKDTVRLRIGAESVALTVTGAGGKKVTAPLSAIVRLGVWDVRFGAVRAFGAPVTEVLASLGTAVPEGKALCARSADGTERIFTDISGLFAAWQATENGSGVDNALALRLYWDGGELADLTALTVCDAPETAPAFSDLGDYPWAAEAAETLFARGVIAGDGTGRFLPGAQLRRGDFVLMLANAFALTGGELAGFEDVDPSSYYAGAIAAAQSLGIAKGSGGRFYPDAPITRQEALTLLYRTLEVRGAAPAERAALDGFADAGKVADWAADAVSALVAAGVVRGDGERLHPAQPITRAEMAVALCRALGAENS